jgi:hypothetical protein
MNGTERPAVLVRHSGGEWRAPGVTTYSDEEALELLLEQTPELLPGLDTGPMAVVRQLYVPETGPVDLLIVGIDGALTIVECKLQSNPDIRRRVVGQVVAYAAGLWRLSFEELDSAFAARAGKTLSTTLAAVVNEVGGDFDEVQFRHAVSANLAAGRFRLIIAVDAITEELKRIVEYLNDHTVRDVEMIAFEVGYAADGDVELLIPAVYGQEAVRRKAAQASTQRWDEQAFRQALSDWCSQEAAAGLLAIYNHSQGHPAMTLLYFGKGRHPSVIAWFDVSGVNVAVWSIYTDPLKTVFAMNFEWMHRRGNGVAAEPLERLADRLRPLPGVAALYDDLAKRGYNKRASIPADQLFTAPDAATIIIEAIDELIGGDTISGSASSSSTDPISDGRPSG